MPETLFTVWVNLFERGFAADGDWVLVHGGTSGIGTMAIALGKLFGLNVIVTCGTDEKCARSIELGAEMAVNYRTEDFVEAAHRITDGKGVAVVLDMVGGDYVPRELKCLAEDGRLVFIAYLRGPKTELDIDAVMRKRLTITGSTLRPRSSEFKAYLAKNLHEKIWPLVEAGRIKPQVYKTFRLEDAAEAHRLMESSQHIGKIVLTF